MTPYGPYDPYNPHVAVLGGILCYLGGLGGFPGPSWKPWRASGRRHGRPGTPSGVGGGAVACPLPADSGPYRRVQKPRQTAFGILQRLNVPRHGDGFRPEGEGRRRQNDHCLDAQIFSLPCLFSAWVCLGRFVQNWADHMWISSKMPTANHRRPLAFWKHVCG